MDYLPTSPTEKGGSRCREGGGKPTNTHKTQLAGGKVSPGVISPMNPGPYRPLCVGGLHVGGGQRTAPRQGGVLAARWSPAPLGTGSQVYT